MQRRDFSLSLAASGLALGLTPALAQGPVSFKSGKDYMTLDRPIPTDVSAGQVEVIEFFWYSCPHCNAFEPSFEQWRSAAPKHMVVRRVPVSFRSDFEPQQRLYYTLEAMGLVNKLHGKVFQAIHTERLALNTDAAIAAWVAKQGVDAAKFAETAKSFGVSSKIRRAVQLQNDYRVEGVPALGVAGRYYTDGSLANGMDRALKVVEFLVAQSRGK